jgi:hypothetical protein
MSTVIDFHDDGGLLLVREAEAIPDYIKQASAISLKEVDELPEDLFALVLVDGSKRLRKYACHDPAHTEISTFYLLRTYPKLTPDAVKVAAANLIQNRQIYHLPAEPMLAKLAETGGEPTGLGNVAEPKQGPKETGEATSGGQTPEQKLMPTDKVHPTGPDTMEAGESKERANQVEDLLLKYIENRREGLKMKVAAGQFGLPSIPEKMEDPSQAAFDARDQARSSRPADVHVGALMPKVGDLTGTEAMPVGAKPKMPKDVKKMAAWGNMVLQGGRTVEQLWPAQVKTARHAGPLAIDTLEEIAEAEEVFSNSVKLASIDPSYRAPVARAIAERKAELGLGPSVGVAEYAGEFYKAGEDLFYAMMTRKRLAERMGKQADYSMLPELRKNLPAQAYAEKLAELDRRYGLDGYWNTEWIDDPWKATLAFEKRATIVYSKGDVFVADKHLEWLAQHERQHLTKILDEDMVEEFCKNPIPVFNSMPEPMKKVLGRLAMDRTWHGEVRET